MYGKILAVAVDLVLRGKMKPITGPLNTVFETVDIPFHKVPTRSELQARLEDRNPAIRRHSQFLLTRIERDGKLPVSYPYPVQVWKFGRAMKMIVLAGEVVVDYSLRLKSQYGWDNTWVAAYANDVFGIYLRGASERRRLRRRWRDDSIWAAERVRRRRRRDHHREDCRPGGTDRHCTDELGNPMLLEEMTWEEVNQLDRSTVVVAPFGAVEQHSLHLPLETDALIASELSRRLDTACDGKLLVMPTQWLGPRTIWASAAPSRRLHPPTSRWSRRFWIPSHRRVSRSCCC